MLTRSDLQRAVAARVSYLVFGSRRGEASPGVSPAPPTRPPAPGQRALSARSSRWLLDVIVNLFVPTMVVDAWLPIAVVLASSPAAGAHVSTLILTALVAIILYLPLAAYIGVRFVSRRGIAILGAAHVQASAGPAITDRRTLEDIVRSYLRLVRALGFSAWGAYAAAGVAASFMLRDGSIAMITTATGGWAALLFRMRVAVIDPAEVAAVDSASRTWIREELARRSRVYRLVNESGVLDATMALYVAAMVPATLLAVYALRDADRPTVVTVVALVVGVALSLGRVVRWCGHGAARNPYVAGMR